MVLNERIGQNQKREDEKTASLHGLDLSGGSVAPGQPAVGEDPTQGPGTTEWQRAVQMGLQVNARNRRN